MREDRIAASQPLDSVQPEEEEVEVEPKEEEAVIEEEVEKESEEAHQADPAPTGFAMVDAQSSRWPRQRRQWSSMPFLTPEEELEVRPATNDHDDGNSDINFIHICDEKYE